MEQGVSDHLVDEANIDDDFEMKDDDEDANDAADDTNDDDDDDETMAGLD